VAEQALGCGLRGGAESRSALVWPSVGLPAFVEVPTPGCVATIVKASPLEFDHGSQK